MNLLKNIFCASCITPILLFLVFFSSISSAAEETPDARIQKCINCCNDKQTACYHLTGDRRLCYAEYVECEATCKSEGKSPSEWRQCWIQSDE